MIKKKTRKPKKSEAYAFLSSNLYPHLVGRKVTSIVLAEKKGSPRRAYVYGSGRKAVPVTYFTDTVRGQKLYDALDVLRGAYSIHHAIIYQKYLKDAKKLVKKAGLKMERIKK
jgi:hypothetical protein